MKNVVLVSRSIAQVNPLNRDRGSDDDQRRSLMCALRYQDGSTWLAPQS